MKKLRSLLSIFLVAVGGGLLYVSSGNIFYSASADSLASDTGATSTSILLLAIGVVLIAAGIMSALFIFAGSKGDN